MLPHPDAETLSSNPQFSSLWKDLSRNKIQWNGVSKGFEGKEVIGVRDTLRKRRIQNAEMEVLGRAVEGVGYSDDGTLDADLQETVQIISAQLEGKLGVTDADIVEVEVEEFVRNIETVASVIERHIEQNMELICMVLDPEKHIDANALPKHLQALKTEVEDRKNALGARRVELSASLTKVLTANAELLQLAIRTLEQVMHGSVGRHSRAQAEHLAYVAMGIEKRVMVVRKAVVTQVYGSSGNVEAQLRRKTEDVEARIMVLKRRLRDRVDWLEELESVQGLEGAVAELRRMREETAKVREEVERLEMQ